MRVGDAYLTVDLGYGQDEWSPGYGRTTWQVAIITRIDGEKIATDAYFGGPSIPWRFAGEFHIGRALFLGEQPMTDLEKDHYNFSEMSPEEQAAQGEYVTRSDTVNSLLAGLSPEERAAFAELNQEEQDMIAETLLNAYNQRTGKNAGKTGILLGVIGVAVALLMMMR